MASNKVGMLVVIIVYLAFMVIVGVFYSRKNKNVSDFYLGGRKLGPLVTAMSAEASDMSSWLLMGLPGLAYLSGCAEPGWTAIGLAVGTYFNWLLTAKRLRRYSEKIHAITIPDFFSNRFHDKSHSLLAISAIIIVVFFVPYTASGFAACGKLFSSLFGVPYFGAVVVAAIIIVAYTALGGFLAASTTDLIQSIVMTLALVIVVFFGLHVVGGTDTVIANAKSLDGYLTLMASHNAETGGSTPYSGLVIASTLAWGLGYFGMPHILLRFMGTKDDTKLKLSRRIASIWVVIAMFIAIAIGVIGLSMSKAGIIPTLGDASASERLIIEIAFFMSQHGILLVIVGGLILSGILACTMSTSDSQLLAASSSVSQNILTDWLGIKMSTRSSMILARVTVIIIAIIGVILAKNPDSSVFRIVSFAWAGFGGSFGPVMIFSLFWERTNRNGALAGLIVGAAMIFIWKFLIAPVGGVFAIYELLPAFICASIVIIIVSLATKAPDKEIIEEFESIASMK